MVNKMLSISIKRVKDNKMLKKKIKNKKIDIKINFCGCKISKIPNGIGKLKNFEWFNFNNKISKIPKSLKHFNIKVFLRNKSEIYKILQKTDKITSY